MFLRWGTGLFQTLFPVLLITYLSLILIETLFEGSVTSYIDLDQMLRVVIGVGIIAVLSTPGEVNNNTQHLTTRNIFMITCAGIGGAAIVLYKTYAIGWLSYPISIVCGSLIVLLIALIRQRDEGEEIEGENRRDN